MVYKDPSIVSPLSEVMMKSQNQQVLWAGLVAATRPYNAVCFLSAVAAMLFFVTVASMVWQLGYLYGVCIC